MRFPDHSDLGVVTVEGAGDFLVSMDRVGAAPADVGLVNDMDCPLVGGHEHAFRGPHYFREWLPGTRPVPYALDVERLARALRKMTGTSKVLSALIEEALDEMDGDWWGKPTHDIAGFVAHYIEAAGVTLTQPQPDAGDECDMHGDGCDCLAQPQPDAGLREAVLANPGVVFPNLPYQPALPDVLDAVAAWMDGKDDEAAFHDQRPKDRGVQKYLRERAVALRAALRSTPAATKERER